MISDFDSWDVDGFNTFGATNLEISFRNIKGTESKNYCIKGVLCGRSLPSYSTQARSVRDFVAGIACVLIVISLVCTSSGAYLVFDVL
jgi:hypothetical protein